jgi:hypothetical protein
MLPLQYSGLRVKKQTRTANTLVFIPLYLQIPRLFHGQNQWQVGKKVSRM